VRNTVVILVLLMAMLICTGATCAKWIASDDAPAAASTIQTGAGALSAATGGPATPWGAAILAVGNIVAAGINLGHSMVRAKRKA
jgi:uncharacterized membrane protein